MNDWNDALSELVIYIILRERVDSVLRKGTSCPFFLLCADIYCNHGHTAVDLMPVGKGGGADSSSL